MPPLLRPDRILGRTGVSVPLVGYGTAPLGKPDVKPDFAARCLNHAIDLGITYVDTSPDYGSEPHVGEAMKSRRDEVFLATKVNNRTRAGVLESLRESLKQLQTDHVDLVQVHSVSAFADLEQALAPDGAVAGLEEAKRQGMCRYIGITGHARPSLLGHALTQYPFDTVLCALGAFDRLVTSPETFLLPRARETNTGVIAMKVLGHGVIQNRRDALRYSLGLPGVALAIVGMKAPEEIDEIADYASRITPLAEKELDELITQIKHLVQQDSEQSKQGPSQLFWLHDTSVMGWSQHDEPAMVAY